MSNDIDLQKEIDHLKKQLEESKRLNDQYQTSKRQSQEQADNFRKEADDLRGMLLRNVKIHEDQKKDLENKIEELKNQLG